jgi:hypothetical protein
MLVLNSDNHAMIDIQVPINKVIDDLSEWTATLPFTGVAGSPGPVNLFEYTKTSKYRAKRGSDN